MYIVARQILFVLWVSANFCDGPLVSNAENLGITNLNRKVCTGMSESITDSKDSGFSIFVSALIILLV